MKHILSIIFSLWLTTQVFAQDNPSSGQIKVYDSYQPPNGSTQSVKNKVAINPLGVFIGDYSIFYERMLGKIFSIEGSIGVTYQNYFYENINMQIFDSYYTGEVISKPKTGITYSIAPKLYLNDDDFEGTYIGMYIRSRTYNTTATGSTYGGSFSSPIEQYYRINTVTFNLGHNYHLGSNILLDYYGGIGMRFTTLSQVEEIYASGSNNSTYELQTSKKTTPTGVYGIKIAYIF
jgi:hypothetical protein